MRSVRMTIWVMAVASILVLFLNPTRAYALTFNDGQIHNIDYDIDEGVYAFDASFLETTVNLLPGGSISTFLAAYGHSQINVSGGSVNTLDARDNSQVTISGGSINNSLGAYDDSQIDISGGSIGDDLFAYTNSQIDISGGSIGQELYLNQSSILTIYGSDFAIDGQLFGYGELTSILGGSYSNEPSRLLTGTLANGDLLDNDFYIGHDASIVLVPEPATLLLLGFGAVMLRTKRKT